MQRREQLRQQRLRDGKLHCQLRRVGLQLLSTTAFELALDSSRNAYVLGLGLADNSPFVDPVSTTGNVGIQTLSADGSKLLFSTNFMGGLNADSNYENGFVVDKSGNIWVASTTGPGIITTTPGAFQRTATADSAGNPSLDGYVVKISPIAVAVPTPDAGVGGAGGGAGGKGGAGGVGGTTGATDAGGGRGGAAGGADAGQADAATFGPGGVAKSGGSSGGCSYSGRAADPSVAVCGLMVLCLLLMSRRRPATRPPP